MSSANRQEARNAHLTDRRPHQQGSYPHLRHSGLTMADIRDLTGYRLPDIKAAFVEVRRTR
jgi:hypothetical protein